MARKRREPESLINAKKYSEFLLWEATGGALGTEPALVNTNENITFAEKRGLLDSILKIATIDRKEQDDDPGESLFDTMRRKNQDNGSKTPKRARNSGAAAPATDPSSDSDTPLPAGVQDDWRS